MDCLPLWIFDGISNICGVSFREKKCYIVGVLKSESSINILSFIKWPSICIRGKLALHGDPKDFAAG